MCHILSHILLPVSQRAHTLRAYYIDLLDVIGAVLGLIAECVCMITGGLMVKAPLYLRPDGRAYITILIFTLHLFYKAVSVIDVNNSLENRCEIQISSKAY